MAKFGQYRVGLLTVTNRRSGNSWRDGQDWPDNSELARIMTNWSPRCIRAIDADRLISSKQGALDSGFVDASFGMCLPRSLQP